MGGACKSLSPPVQGLGHLGLSVGVGALGGGLAGGGGGGGGGGTLAGRTGGAITFIDDEGSHGSSDGSGKAGGSGKGPGTGNTGHEVDHATPVLEPAAVHTVQGPFRSTTPLHRPLGGRTVSDAVSKMEIDSVTAD